MRVLHSVLFLHRADVGQQERLLADQQHLPQAASCAPLTQLQQHPLVLV